MIFIKKTLSTTLAISLLSTNAFSYSQNNITDIKGHWSETNIDLMIKRNVLAGYPDDTFRPDNFMTRAEFITLINNYFGLKNKSIKSVVRFKDVSPNDWFYEQVKIAVSYGYITGYSDNTFRPNDYLTREEAVNIICNLTNISDINIDKLPVFSDSNNISGSNISYIEGAIKSGILVGYENNCIRPKDNITRAESVTIISRLNRDLSKYEIIKTEFPSVNNGYSDSSDNTIIPPSTDDNYISNQFPSVDSGNSDGNFDEIIPPSNNSTNSTAGTGNSTNSTAGTGNSTNSTAGTGNSTNSTAGTGNSTNSTAGTGNSTNSTAGTGNSTNSTAGTGNSTNSTAGTGNSTNSTAGTGNSTNSTAGTGNSTNSTAGTGNSTNSTAGTGNTLETIYYEDFESGSSSNWQYNPGGCGKIIESTNIKGVTTEDGILGDYCVEIKGSGGSRGIYLQLRNSLALEPGVTYTLKINAAKTNDKTNAQLYVKIKDNDANKKFPEIREEISVGKFGVSSITFTPVPYDTCYEIGVWIHNSEPGEVYIDYVELIKHNPSN